LAAYKQPCRHCGEFIARDARVCPECGKREPFGCHCPSCLKPVEKGQLLCPGCQRPLYTACPSCKQQIFVTDGLCEKCGANLMVRCSNSRCGELQFFENVKCTACGQKIK
jgi:RNA polymerase subunit RPABC4/transcription elongation factor Spt4